MKQIETKYRAWDGESKRMSKPFKIDSLKFGYIPDIDNCIMDKDLVLMQYIGLKDKNKVEIYHGDIIEVKFSDSGAIPWEARQDVFIRRMIVKEEKEFLGFYFHFEFPNKEILKHSPWDAIDEECFREIKVIGNIYENKELLKL